MNFLEDKLLIAIIILCIVSILLLLVAVLLVMKSHCTKGKKVDSNVKEEIALQNVNHTDSFCQTEEAEDDVELTIMPQYTDNIKNYLVKTADNSGVVIGKIHSIGRRDNQQDSFAYSDVENIELIQEKGILLIVADGMGGLTNGAQVSSLLVVSMLKYFDSKMSGDNLSEELYNMVLYANQEVNDFLGEDQLGKSGSTVVATLIRDHKMYWISVGDSGIFLYHEQHLQRINPVHNYAQDLNEMVLRGEISEQEAQTHPNRAALTSYIGAGEITHISQNYEPIELFPGDRVLLASDGIFGTASMEEMEELMHLNVGESALKLKYLIEAKNKRNQDNYTAIIMQEIDE